MAEYQSDAAVMSELRQRFPKPTLAASVFQGLSTVGMNAYLLYLVLNHESSPLAIALYGVVELMVMSIIANVALTGVPKELRVGSPDVPVVQRVFMMAVVAAVLCGIAWLGLSGDRERIDQLLRAPNPINGLRELNILWPLLATAALALFGSIGDRLRWRGTGGPFVTGAALAATPKLLTAIMAPIIAVCVSDGIGGNDRVHAAIVWCIVYLGIKSAFELLVLAWQFFGMPEREPARRKNTQPG